MPGCDSVESGEVHVDHLRRKAGQVEHGLGDEAPADAEVRAPELGVGLLQEGRPELRRVRGVEVDQSGG